MSLPDFILIPVVLGPGKVVDMWLRAALVDAFQSASPNPMGVRSYIRTKYSNELIPTSESCSRLLATLRGEQHEVADNIVSFSAWQTGLQDQPDPNNDGDAA